MAAKVCLAKGAPLERNGKVGLMDKAKEVGKGVTTRTAEGGEMDVLNADKLRKG